MEEAKYIPGDLVRINGVVNVIDGIYPKSFSKDSVVEAHAIEGDNTNRYRYDLDFGKMASIQPITLTPVILEDNGWIYHYDIWAEKGFVVLSQNEGPNWEVLYKMPKFGRPLGNTQVIDSQNPLCEIRYVHQLQHLLFGLGLPTDIKI